MATLPILRYPHEALGDRAEAVSEIDADVRRLVRDMIETMHAAPGVGLAANQIGVTRQIAVVDVTAGEKPGNVLVLINPRIIEIAGTCVEDEGCLSLPGFTERVARPERCVIEAMDLEGAVRKIESHGLLSRAFNHEIDHLNGRLFIEHLSALKRRLIKKKVQKRIRSGEWQLVPA